MSDNPSVGDLTYELLKRMNARFERYELEQLDLKMRVAATEDHTSAIVTSLTAINAKLDRMEERLGRIERRLDLVDVR